jgi:lipopolysaccharide transport system ATP-binding protein
MAQPIVDIEGISKQYRYGKIGTGSIRQDLHRWWYSSVLKKENRFFEGLPDESQPAAQESHFWALKDISFQINEGDVWGIIGQNGAGKSTLLKILSKITKPTSGRIRGRGKISSLLEVGIGFQPELSGRENIFLSGHILGMKNTEIKAKLDEIIDFAGVGKFIDTPVKRYSTGMYMRLAFSVAAFLEPDILIVDEVLAVGDAEFQKKCLNKMQDVAVSEGRTILFVSHNLQAISNLCTHALWLRNGLMHEIGRANEVVHSYTLSFTPLEFEEKTNASFEDLEAEAIELSRITVKANEDEAEAKIITVKTPVIVDADFISTYEECDLNINMKLFTSKGECVFNIGTRNLRAEKGLLKLKNIIPANLLNNGVYSLSFTVFKNNSVPVKEYDHCIQFEIEDDREGINYFGPWQGIIRPQIDSYFYQEPVNTFSKT